MKLVRRHRESSDESRICDVDGCEESSYKSVNEDSARTTSLKFSQSIRERKKGSGRHATGKFHLCKEHSKVYKKETKDDREMDRLSRK